jgi:hypothetical protein
MIRVALLLCTGMLTAVCVACAQYPTPPTMVPTPPPPSAGGGPPVVVQSCSADEFVSRVKVLKADYNPTANPYAPPTGDISPGTNIQDDLRDAFSNAPQKIRDHLCALTRVFINSTGCPNNDVNNCSPFDASKAFGYSWGFRSRDQRPGGDKGSTYIAISAGLWPSNSRAWPLSSYENLVLQSYAGWSNGPSISTADPDETWMTVLAALAHELGHVRWAITTIPTPGVYRYDFSKLENCLVDGSSINFFWGWKYNNNRQLLQPYQRWRGFHDRKNDAGPPVDHSMTPLLNELDGSNAFANRSLYNLYRRDPLGDEPWASLFGAQTPDEDFVESYVLYALLGKRFDDPGYNGSYLASLPLTIPGWTDPSNPSHYPTQWADVPRDLLAGRKFSLGQKIKCIRDLPSPP